MAMDEAEKEMERILAKNRANTAASNTGSGYVKKAVKAIRKSRTKRQKAMDAADPSYRS